jgi:hypothetical protein
MLESRDEARLGYACGGEKQKNQGGQEAAGSAPGKQARWP